MTKIDIKDIGPVVEFSYKLKGHGLHILKGPQGAGKTTILRTVQWGVDGRTDVKPTKRDGAPRGTANIAGKSITIMKQTRADGELSVDGLGELDIAALHTPKFVGADTRDKHRIAALVRLGGVVADPSLFYDLVGGQDDFDEMIPESAVNSDDLVEMAGKIKRAIEAHAVEAEGNAETFRRKRREKLAMTEGVNTNAPHDEGELTRAAADAAMGLAKLQQKREDGLAAIELAGDSEAMLREAEDGAVSVTDAQGEVDKTKKELDKQDEEIKKISDRLNKMNLKRAEGCAAWLNANKALKYSEQQEETFAKLRTTIKAGKGVECPTEADIGEATTIHETASRAVTDGVQIRAAITASEEAGKIRDKINVAISLAQSLRDAAKGTHEILSDAIARVPDCPLRVKAMDDSSVRLVLKTDRSDDEPFDELSDGERWPHIIRLASASNRLIVLPQAAYGEFTDTTRKMLHELAIEHKCYLLTAQADDGELRAGPYQEGSE